jgi:periplasmic protein TonB
MVEHPDMFDAREPLGKWLVGSIVLHISVIAALMAHNFIHGPRIQMGDPRGGGFGAVAVSAVSTIPLPSTAAPKNLVANDTQSNVPTPPPAKKAQPKVKAPDPDAIAIGKKDTHRPAPVATAAPNKFREQQKYDQSQLYSNTGQAASSPMIGKQGAGGVGIGNSSPFGGQYGYYANILQQRVAQNWKTGDIDPRITNGPRVTVTFTIQKDGSLAPGSVKITQRSGIAPLDYSAQRAIFDAAPFPPLPQGFPRSQADIELSFELRR